MTERVRTFLRLEFLFAQYEHHRQDHSEFGVRATMDALLDILVVLSRYDLKSDILKELNDQQVQFTRLAMRPNVDRQQLDGVLDDITQAQTGLQRMVSQFAGSQLRESDFLDSILKRSSIPGGTCGFDLPHYHFWLAQAREHIRRDLDAWWVDVRPFCTAVDLYLRLLRGSVEIEPMDARRGMSVITPPGPALLIRVLVPIAARVYPEISAGKHRCTVRFMQAPKADTRPVQASADIPFQIQFCAL